MKLNPYLTLNDGKAQEAIDYYCEILGASCENVMHFNAAPFDVPEDSKNDILHAHLKLGHNDLMLSDTMPGYRSEMGSNVHLSIALDAKEEGEAIFAALEKEGDATMPFEEAFWGGFFGAVRDKFGIHWMISTP
jgi:PhnB protein